MSLIRLRSAEQRAHLDPAEPVIAPRELKAWLDARQILDEAREQAQAIAEQARAAFEEEKRRGYEDGLAQARMEQTERMIDNASQMVEFFSATEQRMVSLVMQAVKRIVAGFDDQARVIAVVQSGLAVMRNQKQLTLRLPPEHLEFVRGRAAQLLEKFPGVGMIDFVADSRLKGDAAIFESEIGIVEASLQAQLDAIEKGFLKMLGSRA